MKRREFIRQSALGAAIISTPGIYFSCQTSEKKGHLNCFKPVHDIPVIEDVDVLIVGGSAAGVSVATRVVKEGGSAFLVSDHPYLGEDICGTFHYWDTGSPSTALARKLFGQEKPHNPIFYKRVLDEELLQNNIGFLYNSFITDILTGQKGEIAGGIISNRSGQQAIKAKTIVDATRYATVARIFNVPFQAFGPGKQNFHFTVVGNNKKEGYQVNSRKANFALQEGPVPVLKYTFEHTLEKDTFQEFQQLEQKARDITWDPNQMDSADDLAFVPPNPIHGKEKYTDKVLDVDGLKLSCLQPGNTKGLFVLNAYADISRTAIKELLKPCNMMALGEKVGKKALEIAKQKTVTRSLSIFNAKGGQLNIAKNVKPSFDFIRPAHVKGTVEALSVDLPVIGEYDVVVMGGGTAGAPAAIGAARGGANTLVIEQLHGLGGTGTLGLIGRYWHGYKEGFTREIDENVLRMGGENHSRMKHVKNGWITDWKMEYYRREIRKAGGEIWFGAIGAGALVNGNKVEGVIVATPFGKGVVKANKVIDSTGSADIAIAAGAAYRHTDKNCLAVQGAGLPPVFSDRGYCNTDWTFINDTDIYDIWRTFVAGKNKYDNGYYDIGKLPQTRERRRIVGDHEISVLDVYNNRTYPDTVSIHKSSFDTHGFTISPFFSLKPPEGANIDKIAEVPLRSLLPKGLENILVTGLGASAHRDAMPVIRMQPCLQNQGYTLGILAAVAAKDKKSFRNFDIKIVQEKMAKIGSLPVSVLVAKDNFPPTEKQLDNAVKAVTNDLDQLETLLWDEKKGLERVKAAYKSSSDNKKKLTYAHIMGFYGIDLGWKELATGINSMEAWDKGWNYTGMGQFGECMSQLDSLIMSLGKTGNPEAIPVITKKARQLTPGSEFSHFRAIAVALENFHGKEASDTLYDLLNLQNIQGHAFTTIEKAKSAADQDWTNTKTRDNSLKELVLSRGLYLCGDKDNLGKNILEQYARDLRGHYARHAMDVLNLC